MSERVDPFAKLTGIADELRQFEDRLFDGKGEPSESALSSRLKEAIQELRRHYKGGNPFRKEPEDEFSLDWSDLVSADERDTVVENVSQMLKQRPPPHFRIYPHPMEDGRTLWIWILDFSRSGHNYSQQEALDACWAAHAELMVQDKRMSGEKDEAGQ